MYVSTSQRVLVVLTRGSNASDEVTIWSEILWLIHYCVGRKKKDRETDHKYTHLFIYLWCDRKSNPRLILKAYQIKWKKISTTYDEAHYTQKQAKIGKAFVYNLLDRHSCLCWSTQKMNSWEYPAPCVKGSGPSKMLFCCSKRSNMQTLKVFPGWWYNTFPGTGNGNWVR